MGNGISVYGQACDSKLKRIQTLQKQVLKVLAKKIYLFSTYMLHNEFEVLKINDIVKQEIITFVHNFFYNSLPPVFDDYFEILAGINNRNTRHGNNLIKIPKHYTNLAGSSIKIHDAKVWNRLDHNLKNIKKVKNSRNKF